jgi:hypothetical protein
LASNDWEGNSLPEKETKISKEYLIARKKKNKKKFFGSKNKRKMER